MAQIMKVDVPGKLLIARRRIPVKSAPWDDSPVTRYVETENVVGKVYTWVEPNQGRSYMHWGFKDGSGGGFWTEHHQGWYDENNLKEQIEAAKIKEPETITSTLSSIGTKAIGTYIMVQLAKAFIFKK